jgi:glycosyltransferase involved in cell wall biosynthesis
MVAYTYYEADNRVMRYAETLARRGDRVDVIALQSGNRPTKEVLSGVNLFRIQDRSYKEKTKISYLWNVVLFLLKATLFVGWRDIKLRYRLIHVHSVPDFLVFTAVIPKLRGAKVILDIHDILPEFYISKFGSGKNSIIYKMLLATEKVSAAFADHVIIANHIWEAKLLQRSVPRNKLTTLLNYPDTSIFKRKGKNRNDGKCILIYPGSLNWHQGLDIAIRAFAGIKHTVPNAEFHIYGVGPELLPLTTLIKELHVEREVKFLGQCNLRDVALLMENSDIGIVPKRNDSFGGEAFSTKILEFMTMGVPVIVAETKIDRYYFDDSAVKFFTPGNEESLAEAMLDLIRDPEARGKIAQNASKFVGQYNWEANQNKYLTVVDDLTNVSGSGAVSDTDVQTPQSVGETSEGIHQEDPVTEYFRCPQTYVRFTVDGSLSKTKGYFRFGGDILCYGRSSGQIPVGTAGQVPDEIFSDTIAGNGITPLPFDLREIVENLRRERYSEVVRKQVGLSAKAITRIYYFFRPLFPVGLRRHLQRWRLKGWDRLPFPQWPVDSTVDRLLERVLLLSLRAKNVDKVPFIWFWPDGASSAAIMTHDVETVTGRNLCSMLMDMNDSYGIKASFQVIPEERYEVSPEFLQSIRERGFEVVVHDLNHDGRLFENRDLFVQRVARINSYGREFGARGFRAAILYRNQSWFDDLDFSYDMSVPNVGHLDPQRGGCCTVMPHFVNKILEIPVTVTQDYTLFNILNEWSIALWRRQIDLIMAKHGLISIIIHPDYVTDSRERKVFDELLAYLAQLRDEKGVWITTSGEVDRWWRQRSKMELVKEGDGWRIEGPGSERARIAYASEKDGRLAYSLEVPASVC